MKESGKKNPSSGFHYIGLCFALLALLGCKSARCYRGQDSIVRSDGQTNCCTAFVEFDDQGELHTYDQVTKAVNEIGTNPVLLVVYVHGWKNDADLNNDNVKSFNRILQGLALEAGQQKQKVVGVYFGWCGDLLRYPDPLSNAARQLTFWSRKNAAERVAGTSATEALYEILQAANANPGSRVVLIGHSMGALLLERTLSQAMVSSLLSNKDGLVRPPADLVLLINSAAPSIYARQFISMLNRHPKQFDLRAFADRPLIVSITSKGDWATGAFFPIGMWLGSLTKSFRSYETNDIPTGKQARYYRTTPGHNFELVSHRVTNTEPQKVLFNPDGTKPSRDAILSANFQTNLNVGGNQKTFKIITAKTQTDYEILLKKKSHGAPYWVIRMPTSVIKNHGDIFNPRVVAVIGAFLRFTQVTEVAAVSQ